jgi:SAM-dependent methyltransferase
VKYDGFIKISSSIANIDLFYIRSSILQALKETLPLLKGNLLDIGCGKMPYKAFILSSSNVEKYIGIDIEGAIEYDKDIKPDFTWDGQNLPFESNTFNCCIATEVLEHCPDPEIVLKEINRILNPDGIFFFTVPFIWNLHEVPYDEYRYTPFSLTRHLQLSGFKDIKIKATGGWNAAMAQMIALWVRRSHLSEGKKNLLSLILKPLIMSLIKSDRKFKNDFVEGQMITGIYGTARK